MCVPKVLTALHAPRSQTPVVFHGLLLEAQIVLPRPWLPEMWRILSADQIISGLTLYPEAVGDPETRENLLSVRQRGQT